jgi:DNA-binding transcriptional regulator YiaG
MKKDYLFTGFGFDILIKNAPMSVVFDEECLDLNMKDLEELVIATLLKSTKKLSGPEVKFLRKHFGLSVADVSSHLRMNESNLKFWERSQKTGFSQTEEYAFRSYIIDTMLSKKKYEFLNTSILEESSSLLELELPILSA